MDGRRRLDLVLLTIVLTSACLAGCTGCDAQRHAEAQSLDGGFVVPQLPSYAGPAICFVEAERRTRLLDDQAFLLCQGAASVGPVVCYAAARREVFLTDGQLITLCRCAAGTEPVACVDYLDRETWLTDREILQLCSPTLSGALLSNCRPAGGWY